MQKKWMGVGGDHRAEQTKSDSERQAEQFPQICSTYLNMYI